MMEYRYGHWKENIGVIFLRILLFGTILAGGLWMGEGISMANSPAAARNITISPVNVPEQAKYVDLLIPMTREDPCYSSYNQAAGNEAGITNYAPIVGYMDKDGYISYTFHMKHAASRMMLEKRSASDEDFASLVFGDGAYIGGQTHLEYIQNNFGTIKAALLDKDGNVVAVSDAASIKPGPSGYLTGAVQYDCSTGQLSPSIYKGNVIGKALLVAILIIISMLSLALRAVFTATVELGAALVFRIRPRSVVLLVNVISNTMFNLLLILTNIFFLIPYLIFVIVGETMVVLGEYSVYCRLLSSFSRRRLLAFTIMANLLSLLLGLGLNYLFSGAGVYGLVH